MMTSALQPFPDTTHSSETRLIIQPSARPEDWNKGSPRTRSEREAEQRRFIQLFQEYLNLVQTSARAAVPPAFDVSEIRETSQQELEALQLEYSTKRNRLLDLRQGCCKTKGYKIASYVARTGFACSALALLGTSIAYYMERSSENEFAESIACTVMAGLTGVNVALKAKCISMEAEQADLEGDLKEQLAQARVFNHLIQTVSEYQKTIYARDTDRTVELLKEAIATLVQVDDGEINIDKVTSSFLLMLPLNHEVRQVFETECRRVVSSTQPSSETCSLSNPIRRDSMIDPRLDVMVFSTKEEGEYKTPHGRTDSQESSPTQVSPGETPPTLLRRTSASLMTTGIGEKFDVHMLEERPLGERRTPSLRGRVDNLKDPLYSQFGISLNTIFVNNRSHPRRVI